MIHKFLGGYVFGTVVTMFAGYRHCCHLTNKIEQLQITILDAEKRQAILQHAFDKKATKLQSLQIKYKEPITEEEKDEEQQIKTIKMSRYKLWKPFMDW